MKKALIALSLTSLILSACSSKPEPLNEQEEQKAQVVSEESKAEKSNLEIQEPTSLVEEKEEVLVSANCTDEPIQTDIGRLIFPIDTKYQGLGFLGEFFTAYKCGASRVGGLFGIDGSNYTLGSSINLKQKPSNELVDQFKALGFQCGEEVSDSECMNWKNQNSINIDELFLLEPYAENFASDDCVNCG